MKKKEKLVLQGDIRFSQENYLDALKFYRAALRIDPTDPLQAISWGLCVYNTQGKEAAQPLFDLSYDIEKVHKGQKTWGDIAHAFMEKEQWDLAEKYCLAAHEKEDNIDAIYHAAVCQEKLGNSNNAMALILSFLDERPEDAVGLGFFFHLCEATQQPNIACQYLQELTKKAYDERNAELLLLVAECYLEQGFLNNAKLAFNIADFVLEKYGTHLIRAIDIQVRFFSSIRQMELALEMLFKKTIIAETSATDTFVDAAHPHIIALILQDNPIINNLGDVNEATLSYIADRSVESMKTGHFEAALFGWNLILKNFPLYTDALNGKKACILTLLQQPQALNPETLLERYQKELTQLQEHSTLFGLKEFARKTLETLRVYNKHTPPESAFPTGVGSSRANAIKDAKASAQPAHRK